MRLFGLVLFGISGLFVLWLWASGTFSGRETFYFPAVSGPYAYDTLSCRVGHGSTPVGERAAAAFEAYSERTRARAAGTAGGAVGTQHLSNAEILAIVDEVQTNSSAFFEGLERRFGCRFEASVDEIPR